jgi:hypothetical protein
VAVILFDLLSLDGQSVMREPWTARRKRRDDVLAGHDLAGVGLVPLHGRCAGALGYLGRYGRRGHRPEGSGLHLSPGCAVAAEAGPEQEGECNSSLIPV